MAKLLCLATRPPCPQGGDGRSRAFHLLRHVAARHRVILGCFVEDALPAAEAAALRELCDGLHLVRWRRPALAALRGLLAGWMPGPDGGRGTEFAEFGRWVRETAARERIDAALLLSPQMLPCLEAVPALPVLADFAEPASQAWAQRAPAHRWPLSRACLRESGRLRNREHATLRRARRAFFAAEADAARWRGLVPDCAERVEVLGNGVDARYFEPQPGRASPYRAGSIPIVLTGAMDRRANAEAAAWFAHEVLPRLLPSWPALRLHLVGRDPGAAVRALASDYVAVSGTVPDLRPHLQHAAVVVAPLRDAPGVRRKVLEAMAMERPVVASPACVEALDARVGAEVLCAAQARDFARKLDALLRSPAHAAALGQAARQRVVQRYGWAAQLRGIDRHLSVLNPVEAAA